MILTELSSRTIGRVGVIFGEFNNFANPASLAQLLNVNVLHSWAVLADTPL